MKDSSSIHSILMLRERMRNKAKIRDISTFVLMGSSILALIPIIDIWLAVGAIVWLITYIVIYFSLKADKIQLEIMLTNVDNNLLMNSFNENNYGVVLAHYNDQTIINYRQQINKIESARDKHTFLYLVISLLLGVIFLIMAASFLSKSLIGKSTSDILSNLTSFVLPFVAVILFAGLINLIVWIVSYASKYNALKKYRFMMTQTAISLKNQSQNQYQKQ